MAKQSFQISQKEQGTCRQDRERGGQCRLQPIQKRGMDENGAGFLLANRGALSSAGMMRGEVQGTRCHSPVISRKTGIISRMCLSADAAKTSAAFRPGNSSFHVDASTRAACSL